MSHRLLLIGAVITATALTGAIPAHAAANHPVAIWEMNEAAGAHVMVDSSGHGINGRIGTEVQTGMVVNGAKGYQFPRLTPNKPPTHPEHLITVPDSSALDPGTRDYAITFRMRTTQSFGNIIQKGQSGVAGGYFKFQAPRGVVQCLFRGSAGNGGVSSNRPLNDGQTHTIRCERTANLVTLTVDGVVTGRHTGPTGNISNTWPLSIAGKTKCDQVKVTCDYFPGFIDRVQIDAS